MCMIWEFVFEGCLEIYVHYKIVYIGITSIYINIRLEVLIKIFEAICLLCMSILYFLLDFMLGYLLMELLLNLKHLFSILICACMNIIACQY